MQATQLSRVKFEFDFAVAQYTNARLLYLSCCSVMFVSRISVWDKFRSGGGGGQRRRSWGAGGQSPPPPPNENIEGQTSFCPPPPNNFFNLKIHNM